MSYEVDGMKIGVVTSNRADYGILVPFLLQLMKNQETEINLLVTGTHLVKEYGYTVKEIEIDGVPIAAMIPILEAGNEAKDIAVTIANAIQGFSSWFEKHTLDLLVVLGDRTEMLGICTAAMLAQIPIAHICGGEITTGAVDDSIRHAITKMASIHFTTTEVYRKRVIQMGEMPHTVFNVGSLSVENILHEKFWDKEYLMKYLGISTEKPLVVTTFHPVTREIRDRSRQLDALMEAMQRRPEYFYLITKSNADVGGREINERFSVFVRNHAENMKLVDSLGRKRYLIAVKEAAFVLGNSSSGLTEAPILGTPTVNIGNRQQGRLRASTVIDCIAKCEDIVQAMDEAISTERCKTTLYGEGNTSEQMVHILKDAFRAGWMREKKGFYDIDYVLK